MMLLLLGSYNVLGLLQVVQSVRSLEQTVFR